MSPIYLDYNATTPVHPEILEQIGSWTQNWGNPSSTHFYGRKAKQVLRTARKNWSKSLNASPLELMWTSGATEGNNACILGILRALLESNCPKKDVVFGPMEHPSVTSLEPYIESLGYKVHHMKMTDQGSLDENHLAELLDTLNVALVSLMTINNETGLIFPIEKVAKIAKAKNILIHSDMVQALGKMPINFDDLLLDAATFSAHKFYALKGCGLTYLRSSTPFKSNLVGGGQERGRRAGTENVLAIQSFGKMADFVDQAPLKNKKLLELQNFFEQALEKEIPEAIVVGKKAHRSPSVTNIILPVSAEILFMNLDMDGICVSTGSACSSGKIATSPSLAALGYSKAEAAGSLRVSYGWFSKKEDLTFFIEKLKLHLNRIKENSNESSYEI